MIRAKIEDDYVKSLVRLAKGNAGQLEIGSVRTVPPTEYTPIHNDILKYYHP